MLLIKRYIIIIATTASLFACTPAVDFAKDVVVDNANTRRCKHVRDETERHQCEKQVDDSAETYDKESGSGRKK